MRRDMDLIRELLFGIEKDAKLNGDSCLKPVIPDYVAASNRPIEEIWYHLSLLLNGGYVKGEAGRIRPIIGGLTWKGHEFLDSVRDQAVWERTKDRISGLPSVSLLIIEEIAELEIRAKLGLS